MIQAIAGVAPPELGEVTIMTVWPTIAATRRRPGAGKLYMIQAGIGKFFTLGKLFMLVVDPGGPGLILLHAGCPAWSAAIG